MMKSSNKESLFQAYKKLSAQKKHIALRSIIFAMFLLAVNVFAWFIYFTKADVDVNASVVSWDVSFLDSNEVINELIITSTDIYPGMTPFTKSIEITNKGSINATFTDEIEEYNIAGTNTFGTTDTTETKTNYLENYYPFKVALSIDKTTIAPNDTANFTVTITWPYEDATKYYQMNNLYLYDPSIDYYTLSGTTYSADSTVTTANYSTKVASGLYMQKDDADGYWGSTCKTYQTTNNTSCLNVKLKLVVTQVNP